MMSDAWKDTERRHARRMGGERIWRQDFSEVAPDGESHYHTWDAKTYKRHAAVTLFKKAEKKYRKYTGKRRFHLLLHVKGYPGDYVVIRAEDFRELCVKAKEDC